jgi:uncharacterized membrane protein YgdD (TMEM256/DUF423 family)
MRLLMVLAAVGGLASVAFGAFAAHGIEDPQAQGWLRTGAEYGLIHCLAVFAAGRLQARAAGVLFLLGVAVFGGTLFAMALGAPRVLGAVTPIGGLSFMAGWATLAWAARRSITTPDSRGDAR